MQKTKLIYVLSPSYSGSTLLTFLMANHPSIGTVGELKATHMGDITRYHCSCGVLLKSCPFWQQLTSELTAEGHQFSEEDFATHFRSNSASINRVFRASVRGPVLELLRRTLINYIPPISTEYRRIICQNFYVANKALELQNATTFLDGSKDCNRLLFLFRSELFDITVVNLVRDELGLLNSMMRRESLTMLAAIEQLERVRLEQKRTIKAIGQQSVLAIDYLELCGDTKLTLNKIYDFVGLDNIHSASLNKSAFHILGNMMRLDNTNEIKVDERWKTDLTATDLKDYEPHRGKLNGLVLVP